MVIVLGSRHWPRSVKELEDLFYNLKRNEDRRKYIDLMLSDVLSPAREEKIRQIFSVFGDVEKLGRGEQKTYDFVIKSKRILIEVTSINLVSQDGSTLELPTMQKFILKLNRAIQHGDEKVPPHGCEDYFKIVAIFYDSMYMAVGRKYVDLLFDQNFVKNKTNICLSKMDAVIFVPEDAYIMSPSGEISYPHIAYVKSQKLFSLLKTIRDLRIVALRC